MYLRREMDVQTGLLDLLLNDGILNVDEKIEIDQLRLPTKRCEKLLSFLRCKTQKQYEIFLEALTATNQSHVADLLRPQGTFSFLLRCHPPPGRGAEYCDQHVCMSVCPFAYLKIQTSRNFL